MQLPTPITAAIQQAINRVLELDELSTDNVAALTGKVVQIHVDGPEVNVYLIFLDDSVDVSPVFDEKADTVLSGSPFALLSLSRSNDSLHDGSVQLTGDMDTGKKLKKLINELDVDWEEQLSGIVGDGIAHKAFGFANQLQGMFARSLNSLGMDTTEYLQEEVQAIAPNSEIEHFCNDVDELNAAYDRAEMRIRLLEQSRTSIRTAIDTNSVENETGKSS